MRVAEGGGGGGGGVTVTVVTVTGDDGGGGGGGSERAETAAATGRRNGHRLQTTKIASRPPRVGRPGGGDPGLVAVAQRVGAVERALRPVESDGGEEESV